MLPIAEILLGLSLTPTSNAFLENTVFERVANKYQLEPTLLYAVALAESGYASDLKSKQISPHPYAIRSDHALYPNSLDEAKIKLEEELLYSDNIDLGMMQINTKWHRDRFHNYEDLFNIETNLEIGAQILSTVLADQRYPELEVRLGHYHSFTDPKAIRSYGRYVMQIYHNLKSLSSKQISSIEFDQPKNSDKVKDSNANSQVNVKVDAKVSSNKDQNLAETQISLSNPNLSSDHKPAFKSSDKSSNGELISTNELNSSRDQSSTTNSKEIESNIGNLHLNAENSESKTKVNDAHSFIELLEEPLHDQHEISSIAVTNDESETKTEAENHKSRSQEFELQGSTESTQANLSLNQENASENDLENNLSDLSENAKDHTKDHLRNQLANDSEFSQDFDRLMLTNTDSSNNSETFNDAQLIQLTDLSQDEEEHEITQLTTKGANMLNSQNTVFSQTNVNVTIQATEQDLQYDQYNQNQHNTQILESNNHNNMTINNIQNLENNTYNLQSSNIHNLDDPQNLMSNSANQEIYSQSQEHNSQNMNAAKNSTDPKSLDQQNLFSNSNSYLKNLKSRIISEQ